MPTSSATDIRHSAATRHMQSGAYRAAIQLLEVLLEDTPDDADILNDAALAYAQQGNQRQAKEYFCCALDAQPGHEPAFYNLIDFLLETQGDSEAEKAFLNHADDIPESSDKEAFRRQFKIKGAAQKDISALDTRADTNALRVAFVCGPDRKFIADIEREISERHEVRTAYFGNTFNLRVIQQVMDWADVTWFEWAYKILMEASNRLRKTSCVLTRLHRWEAFQDELKEINWPFVDALIPTTHHILEAVEQRIPNIAEMTDVHVISSTVDLNQFEFKKREPGFDIAYVGYLNYRKNPPLLLQCIHALAEKDDRYHLHVAGEFQRPELDHYFEHMLDKLDLRENVTMYGWVDDVASWLDNKHYLILSTLHEGNPYSVLEAASKGIRPLVHTFPGSDTLYPDNWTFSSIPELLHLIEEVDYDSSSYRRYVEEHYALSATVDRIHQLLCDLALEPTENRVPHLLNGAQADGPPSLNDLPRAPSGRTGWPWTEESKRVAPTMPNGRDWPLLSVVMPSFNQGKYIEAAIRSVLLQGYHNLEFVVIDGGSSDETVEILEKYDPWITYWQSKTDEGQSDAINQGFEHCSGLLATWLNSDDMLCQDALYTHATRHFFAPDTIYVGNCLVIDERGTVQSRHRGRVHTFEDLVNIKEVWRGQPRGHIIQPEVLFPLDAYRQVGGLSIDNHQTMDYELWGRLLLAGAQIRYTDLDVGMFRVHANQKTSQFWETTQSLTRSTRRLIRDHPEWSNEKKEDFLSKVDAYEAEVEEQSRRPLSDNLPDDTSRNIHRSAGWPQVAQCTATSLPKVSAFMPTYNHEPFIAEAIESVLAQEYPKLELVIGDDASTDGTREIIDTYYRKHPDVIKRIYADENGGITANCNRVLAACTGEYIAFTSGDDVWLPGKIQKQIEWFADHPNHVFCCTRVDMFKSETGHLLKRGPDGDFEHIFAQPPPSRIYQLGTALSSVMIHREALPSGGYDPRVPHASDFLFMVSVLDKGPSGYIDEVLARYRKHADSASNKWSWIYTDHLMALKIMDQKFPQWADDIERIRKVTLHKLHRLHHSESPKQVLVNG